MRSLNIETSIRTWAKDLVARYEWLKIRFEYSDIRNRYLISYYYSKDLHDDNTFFTEAMSFEDKMNSLHGENAPLFCDEEELFKLSLNAESISKPIFIDSFSTNAQPQHDFIEADNPINSILSLNFEYALAA